MTEAREIVPAGTGGRGAAAPWLASLALLLLVAAVYWGVQGFGFVNFDDGRYVYQNAQVRAGLTARGVAWAFASLQVSNWHPLTWLSHMLDVELFGVDPGWHHAVNALLHAANTVLLFVFLRLATGAAWRSFLAAALFGVHPLHVESVAWISERKDVLSTLFGLVALLAYLRLARQPGWRRALPVAAAFALSLLAKPMLVTLPLLLLLLDVWPLGRIPEGTFAWARLAPLLKEKAPLFALSAASCAVTLLAQGRGGSVTQESVLPLASRLANAVLSYGRYLGKTFWPVDLAAVYPHPAWSPAGIPGGEVAGTALLLAGVTALVLWQWRRRPYLAVGWLWYVVALLPVIGVVQVGLQGMADRYTYVPLIGIFVGLVWAVPDAAASPGPRRALLAAAATVVLLAAAATARRQAATWRDSFTLFEHAIAATRDNGMAWRNLGTAYSDAGRLEQAIPALRESVRLMAHDAHTWMNLAITYDRAGLHAEADDCYARALRMRPDDPFILYNLGIALAMRGQWDRLPAVLEQLRGLSPELADRLARRLQGAGGAGAGR